jgi:sugar O-acyltransferase (sialic acid O-acetyltransferase NeuD family)
VWPRQKNLMEKIKDMVFYGASGHAKVVIEAWVASGGTVDAIFDDNKNITELLQYKVWGPYSLLQSADLPHVVSIGANATRKKIVGSLNCRFGKVIHPGSCVSPSSVVNEGSVLMGGSVVNAEVLIGKHVILNTGATIDHDCIIGDYVHISPNATICGGVHIGEGTHVGAGATVIQNIAIGKWATIGAGSVIIGPVPDYAVVVGVPGRIVRFDSSDKKD